MGRFYLNDFPEWAFNPRVRSKVRGWIAWHYENKWEGKRALIQWAKAMGLIVERWEVNAVMKTIEMKERLRLLGYV